MPFSRIRIQGDDEMPIEAAAALMRALERRLEGEPLQYIEGFTDFMGLRVLTDPRALIPRQDTETLAEAAIDFLRALPDARVLDLCTGSGCLALAIKAHVPHARVTAVDLSADALALAKENALRLSMDIEFMMGDLFAPVAQRRFDLIVSNPPYLTDEDMLRLQREVRREPEMALRAGADGLAFYRRIASALPDHLLPGGAAMLEVGAGQSTQVRRMLHGNTSIIRDLTGIERVISLVI